MNPEPVVFVVDDDAAVRDSLALLLDTVGLNVETYASAQEFLNSFDEKQPGCLVADLQMPGMDGFELRRHLIENGIDLPVIIITAHVDDLQIAPVCRNISVSADGDDLFGHAVNGGIPDRSG